MSQYPATIGSMLVGVYPIQQPGAAPSGGIMQPGHNLHPVSNHHYFTQNQQYYHPHSFASNSSSPSPAYSRTPSPAIPPTTPTTHYALAPASYPSNVYQNGQFVGLLAQWPMSGPMYPDNVIAYLGNRGPMPDLNSLQAQLMQVNMDISSGRYDLSNPSIADPRTIKSSWSDNIDVLQT